MRIVSLLPSTTEIVAALGKQQQLVGRSHECDFPEGVSALPSCTAPKFNPDGSSYELDQRVKALLQEGLSVYRVDEEVLAELDPDVIITQDHCEVCAASVQEVKEAARSRLGNDVTIVSVSPTDLSSVVNAIRTIAQAIDAEDAAEQLTGQMKTKLQSIQQQTAKLRHPKVLPIEWMDPLMSGGNWIPELIQLAGGTPLGAEAGSHSPYMQWKDIHKYQPDIITIMPCGYTIEQTLSEISHLTDRSGWNQLQAVKNKQVYLADGNQYFNRPGPRLVESTQILGEIIHPSLFRNGYSRSRGWISLSTHRFHQQIQ